MMGFGDDLLATGMARGAKDRGARIAFGDGRKIIWGPYSRAIFKDNPNIAPPGSERAPDIEWVRYYKGCRIYNRQDGSRWVWNYEFRARPGELFFDRQEQMNAEWLLPGFVLIEPNVPRNKSVWPNKQWPVDRYQTVADWLMGVGYSVVQFEYVGMHYRLERVKTIKATHFRDALACMQKAALYVGPEGGLHHGAAAVGIPAVVLFGGFIPPQVTGYDTHTNLTGGAEACGNFTPCQHCKDAMNKIGANTVFQAAMEHLQ